MADEQRLGCVEVVRAIFSGRGGCGDDSGLVLGTAVLPQTHGR